MRFDADNIGKWLSGYFFSSFLMENLQKLTSTLKEIATKLYPLIIEKIWGGQIIFNSGEELIAFGPMTGGPSMDAIEEKNTITALEIAELVRNAFQKGSSALDSFIEKYQSNDQDEYFPKCWKKIKQSIDRVDDIKGFCTAVDEINADLENSPTICCGLVVAHHKSLLKHSINEVFSAEKFAKKIEEKDSIACQIFVRSGSPITIAGKWDEFTADWTWVRCFLEIYAAITEEDTEKRYGIQWLYDMANSSKLLLQSPISQNIWNIFKLESERLLKRHRCKNKEHHQHQAETILQAFNAALDGISQENIISDSSTPRAALEAFLRSIEFWARIERSIKRGEMNGV